MDELILDYLRDYCNTEDKAVKARELGSIFNITSRELRDVVNRLRQASKPICSSNMGYWYSDNVADIRKTAKRLAGQVKNMSVVVVGLNKLVEAANE